MTDVKLGINLWSQASDWPAFLAAGQKAESLGFDHLWTWDHILAIFGIKQLFPDPLKHPLQKAVKEARNLVLRIPLITKCGETLKVKNDSESFERLFLFS